MMRSASRPYKQCRVFRSAFGSAFEQRMKLMILCSPSPRRKKEKTPARDDCGFLLRPLFWLHSLAQFRSTHLEDDGREFESNETTRVHRLRIPSVRTAVPHNKRLLGEGKQCRHKFLETRLDSRSIRKLMYRPTQKYICCVYAWAQRGRSYH